MTHITRKQLLTNILVVMTALFGGSMAASADTVTEGFDTFKAGWNSSWTAWEITLPEGWNYSGTANHFSAGSTYKTAAPSVEVSDTNTDTYLVTPVLEGEFSFFIRNYTKNYQASITAYMCTFEDGNLSLGAQIGSKMLAKTSSGTPVWEQVAFTASAPTRVALLISRAYFDDFTYTPYVQSAGASLLVTGQPSGSTYDFGAVRDGAAHAFTLNNNGQAALTITGLAVTGGYTITAGSDLTTIAAGESAEVTVSTPAADATGALTIESSDANSPYVVNLTSTYKAPAPIMAIAPAVVNFGKVTANATQDITVSNSGDAELTAAIASDNADFAVSATEVTVAAGAETTFTITYLYNAEAYGSHTATVTVTPDAGDAATVAVSAMVADPNVWTEDFSADTLPEGWNAGNCWTVSDGVAHGQYVHNANNYLTTPALLVSGTADQLTFQARATGIYPDIVIQKSLNGGEWTEFKKIKSDDLPESWTTFTIDGLDAGSYQFRFLSDSYDLDNFEGFKLDADAPKLTVAPAADADFGKVSAQPDALTYSISNTGTGTLTGTVTSSDATLFTVSASEFSLAAGESTTFDVALVFDENYGAKTAVITVHPDNEGLTDVVINATAVTLDPNVWVADFDEGAIPDGWTNSGWTVGTLTDIDNDTPMALAPQSTTAASLITPRLQAKAGDELTWDAYLRWSDEALLVEYTSDEQTWTTLYNYRADDDGQGDKYHKPMAFNAPADGTYRLRFTSKMQNGVDNFRGFTLAPSEDIKETWHVSYNFIYGSGDEAQEESDTETMEVTFNGNNVTFNFPNPINGNAPLRGSMDSNGNYVFPNGQYIGEYGTESAYYCGSDGSSLTDITFFYNEERQQFLCTAPILINSSQTAISYWGYFSFVIVSKEEIPAAITALRPRTTADNGAAYSMQGTPVRAGYKGVVVKNGRKILVK